MKYSLVNTCIVAMVAICTLSCSPNAGDRYYYIMNDTEDTVFYGHTNFDDIKQPVTIVDTILPQYGVLFTHMKNGQHFELGTLGNPTETAEDYSNLNENDYYLKYKGETYYIDALHDKNSFFCPDSYLPLPDNSTYHFMLKRYIELLQ